MSEAPGRRAIDEINTSGPGASGADLPCGDHRVEQALLVLAHLRKGETYADLAAGFAIGTTAVFRYIREALDVLTAMAPALHEAVTAAAGKAFVIVDGTLLRIDRSAWPPAAARASGPMPSALDSADVERG